MEQRSDEVAIEFPFFRIYKDGRIDRFFGDEIVPPSPDSATAARSKDVVISPESGLSARLFIHQIPDPTRKLPLLVYLHGGAFCVGTPFSPTYTGHASSLAAESNAIVLSVHYRRAPEHPLPIAYDDAWEALQWAVVHSGGGGGPEPWLNQHADFDRVFVGGDSAGANIAHYVVLRAGVDGLNGPRIAGLVLVHPFFGNDKPNRLLEIIFPSRSVPNDPRVNPGFDPDLSRLGCGRVLIFVAEKDFLKDRALAYYEALKKSGWIGLVELVEYEGVDHVFHLFSPKCEQAQALVKKVSSFLNQAQAHI
ncbi:putative carboxylesterase 7 [Morus notabilis]|uniref:Putative carboxylesterase 7 n=1 Tax=Morus notabilis TaxID=981085 RepID=W9SMM8_9ROSA|nr:2-hydroxyisoflavanone dehydratase [Morus notabilis]EXC17364.1 putative carboxylesterase 7 [Morus notabilis]